MNLIFKKGFVFAIVGLFIGTSVVQNIDGTEETDEDYIVQNSTSFGTGGWHNETTIKVWGKNYDSIFGDWDWWGDNSIEESPNESKCDAYYYFDDNIGIQDTVVNYIQFGVRFQSFTALGDGPQIKVYNWDDSKYDNLGGNTWVVPFFWYTEERTKNGFGETNPYVNEDGAVNVDIFAWDDLYPSSGDDFANKWVKIKFCKGNEELYDHTTEFFDIYYSDGKYDVVQFGFNVDVAEPGDGVYTTVKIESELWQIMDENGTSIIPIQVDTETTIWSIVDHNIEYGYSTLDSSLGGGTNGYYIAKFFLFDDYGNSEGSYIIDDADAFMLYPDNNPPNTPETPSGRTYLGVNEPGTYSTSAIDPEGDNVKYCFDWDDGTISDWTDLVNSGSPASLIYSWDAGGLFQIKAMACDEYGSESQWSTDLSVIVNDPPYQPNNPIPENQQTGVNINTTLSWIGGDPNENDNVIYDIYFGTTSSPPLVEENYMGVNYNPGFLDFGTKYYWKIVAFDSFNASTIGPEWAFTTANNPPNTPETPSGPTNLGINEPGTYSTSAIDPQGEQVQYRFDWDASGNHDFSDWTNLGLLCQVGALSKT